MVLGFHRHEADMMQCNRQYIYVHNHIDRRRNEKVKVIKVIE